MFKERSNYLYISNKKKICLNYITQDKIRLSWKDFLFHNKKTIKYIFKTLHHFEREDKSWNMVSIDFEKSVHRSSIQYVFKILYQYQLNAFILTCNKTVTEFKQIKGFFFNSSFLVNPHHIFVCSCYLLNVHLYLSVWHDV